MSAIDEPQYLREPLGRCTADPVVRLQYHPDAEKSDQAVSLPFLMGVIADFSGCSTQKQPVLDRNFASVNEHTFGALMQQLAPRVSFLVEDTTQDRRQMDVDLTFRSLADFSPDAVAERIPATAKRRNVRINTDAGADTGFDSNLSEQISLILHHPDFRALEATWRGLWFLVTSVKDGRDIDVRIMDATRSEFEELVDSDQSPAAMAETRLNDIVNRDIFSTEGAAPFGCIILDYEFDHSQDDVAVLRTLAWVGAQTPTVFLSGASPALFGLDRWEDLVDQVATVSQRFELDEYGPWHELRRSEESRHVGLCMPRFLGRPRYGERTDGADDWFREVTTGRASTLVWVNAAYAMGSRILRAFRSYGWCARIRGVESGGLIEGLPVSEVLDLVTNQSVYGSTEFMIDDRAEKTLFQCGVMVFFERRRAVSRSIQSEPVVPPTAAKKSWVSRFFREPASASPPPVSVVGQPPDTAAEIKPFSGSACFIGGRSLHPAASGTRRPDDFNRILASRINAVLCCSTFIQYLRCIVRDCCDTHTSDPEIVQELLTTWSQGYAGSVEKLPFDRLWRPFKEIGIDVLESDSLSRDFGLRVDLVGGYRIGMGPIRFKTVLGTENCAVTDNRNIVDGYTQSELPLDCGDYWLLTKNPYQVGYWTSTDRDCSGSALGVERLPHPRDWVDPDWDAEERDRTIAYLRAGYVLRSYWGHSTCRFGCNNEAQMGCSDLTDGVWIYPEGYAHYLAVHSVRPPERFLDHIRRAGFVQPSLGPVHT